MPPEMERLHDKLAVLKHVALFSTFTDAQLQLMAERTRLVEYKKGERVYQEGARTDAFYIVASGRLRVFTVVDGQEHLYTVLHNGDTFGEVSLLTGETHSATVEALNDTLVLQLGKQDFDDLINRIPPLVLSLSRLLSKRLRTKGREAGSGESKVVSIYSAAPGVGRTVFAVSLEGYEDALRNRARDMVVAKLAIPAGQIHEIRALEERRLAGELEVIPQISIWRFVVRVWCQNPQMLETRRSPVPIKICRNKRLLRDEVFVTVAFTEDEEERLTFVGDESRIHIPLD